MERHLEWRSGELELHEPNSFWWERFVKRQSFKPRTKERTVKNWSIVEVVVDLRQWRHCVPQIDLIKGDRISTGNETRRAISDCLEYISCRVSWRWIERERGQLCQLRSKIRHTHVVCKHLAFTCIAYTCPMTSNKILRSRSTAHVSGRAQWHGRGRNVDNNILWILVSASSNWPYSSRPIGRSSSGSLLVLG